MKKVFYAAMIFLLAASCAPGHHSQPPTPPTPPGAPAPPPTPPQP